MSGLVNFRTQMLEELRGLVRAAVTLSVLVVVALTGAIGQAAAASAPASPAGPRLLINLGNGEISRRLTTLKNLGIGIGSAQFLTATDKSSLSNQVNGEVNGLTSLQSKLNGETTAAAAATDDANVITEYRVYLLLVPKVYIIIAADNQQAAEAALSSAANGFETALTNAQSAGKNISSLQSQLADLKSKLSAAQAISSGMESSVIGLRPSDFNGNNSILVGDYNKLQTAQSDNAAALEDANQLLTGLQALYQSSTM